MRPSGGAAVEDATAWRDPTRPLVAVLVNWNSGDDTLATLAALDRTGWPGLRPLVVDNASTDGSPARIRRQRPDVEVLETGANLGYGGGVTAGLRHALHDPAVGWALVLNTDVELDPGFVAPLVAACRDPGVGAAGPKIYYFDPPDLLWAAGGRLRWRETVTVELGQRQRDGERWSVPRAVSYLTTCCLLVPRDALERVGLFDPTFFLNVEDADWCRRATDAGYVLRYAPESRIWHKVAVSTGGGYTPFKTFHTGRSNALFARRHGRRGGLVLFLAANALALPLALLRELPRGNARAVVSKAKGVWAGLRAPLPPPPRLESATAGSRASAAW
jgi:GT2 family glycosyltransferase